MKVYGSTASPYVRRIRLLLGDRPYEFLKLNIFDPADRERLRMVSPVLKVPVLVDGERVILDSRQIFYYLSEKGVHRDLNLEKENLLTIIDGMTETLVNMTLMKRSGIPLSESNQLGLSHLDRLRTTLPVLEGLLGDSASPFREWNYLSIALFTTLDWAMFRELYSFDAYPGLLKFHRDCLERPFVRETGPRVPP